MDNVVYVGAGSNIDPERHIVLGLEALRQRFGPIRISPVYRSTPVGFDGDDFINLVVRFHSDLEPASLNDALHEIEDACGRQRDGVRFAPRVLDLDLLMVGQRVTPPGSQPHLPRDEIIRYAFVLRPLAELAPELQHPVEGLSMRALWNHHRDSIDRGDLRLVRLDLPAGVTD
ncbi:2-amino-4-hydroxy-6-hydroxymethyldihydropteridine diphosphokinase [Natronospira bacteriovora]|uniref:2-amino-4-hydroxy-6-hydroxymethyldihydropteridine pyrophosphokinase n=1 Tax=Natronospira bacteriovora TaxID=3069753 RepID=A0ABU0W9Y8_9GAMM|nr:2-amino-4-hydroxy-6-hydroxymethyldihydropteridine diphosphokinase [Natronospira sp. AB-CW4]MDQ2070852.1 2-amino-4-hydroxy-6-hydroxymethyldihydropteridine diphosphokinase [Natronospira sp. AB-CW4]